MWQAGQSIAVRAGSRHTEAGRGCYRVVDRLPYRVSTIVTGDPPEIPISDQASPMTKPQPLIAAESGSAIMPRRRACHRRALELLWEVSTPDERHQTVYQIT